MDSRANYRALSFVREAVGSSACCCAQHELASERALAALERILKLSVQVLDGDRAALSLVSSSLAVLTERLADLHEALRRRALTLQGRSFSVLLTAHAERRQNEDQRVLERLSRALAQAQPPRAVGRVLAVAVLSLLSNLGTDERLCRTLDFSYPSYSDA